MKANPKPYSIIEQVLRERPFQKPIDYIDNNKVIPPPPPRAPLPDWYLASIP